MSRQRSPIVGMTDEQRRRFIGGRSRYHARRRFERDHRRALLAGLLRSVDLSSRGWKREIAEQLGVSRWTLRADLNALAGIAREGHDARRERDATRRETFANRVIESLGGARDEIR
jgi:hypothetical protein